MNSLIKPIYYFLRPYIPLDVRWYLQKKTASLINGLRSNPPWPIPFSNLSKINDFWPNGSGSAFLLTHDVESSFGFSNIIEVSEIEVNLGFKSSWNIVPNLYNIDKSVINHLRDHGMEIGVHDWNHDGRLFSKKTVFELRLEKINKTIAVWGAKGFRAGMAFHHDEWMQELACLYDSSYYDTDPYQPMEGGCGHIRPFMLGGIVELPYTMPLDHILFVAEARLNIRDADVASGKEISKIVQWIQEYISRRNVCLNEAQCEIAGVDIWKLKARWLVENGGMVLMVTHPDYLCHPKFRRKSEEMKRGWLGEADPDIQEVRDTVIVELKWHNSLLEQYAAFLNWFKREFSGQFQHSLPMEIAAWYRSSIGLYNRL